MEAACNRKSKTSEGEGDTEFFQIERSVADMQEAKDEDLLEGFAAFALLPSGSLSGHFLHPPSSTCLGLFGTEFACERECSRGEDYRLVNLTILEFSTKRETSLVVECRGRDATRFSNASDIHGWEEDVLKASYSNKGKEGALVVSFECETLKADKDAEEHIKQYLPSLSGCDAIVNIGPMSIRGLSYAIQGSSPNCDLNNDQEINCNARDFGVQKGFLVRAGKQSVDDEIWQLVQEELQGPSESVQREIQKTTLSGLRERKCHAFTLTASCYGEDSVSSVASHDIGSQTQDIHDKKLKLAAGT